MSSTVVSEKKTKKKAKTKTKAKAVKNTKPHPLTMQSLLSMIKQREDKDALVKTAVTTGWLTNGEFMTRLDDNDMEKIKKIYDATARKATPLELNPPKNVGFLVDEAKLKGDKMLITCHLAKDINVKVDANLYLTMMRRHPKASVFLSSENPESDPLIFSEREAVATITLA